MTRAGADGFASWILVAWTWTYRYRRRSRLIGHSLKARTSRPAQPRCASSTAYAGTALARYLTRAGCPRGHPTAWWCSPSPRRQRRAVFGKVGVQSRAELVTTLYVRPSAPPRAAGSPPSPSGWPPDDDQTMAI